jgi:mycothiol system anti-sigma-R factor
MMRNTSCHSALERVYPYLDGELTRYKKFQIKRHLGKCNGCSDVYGFEDRLKSVIGAATSGDLTDDAMARLKTMLKEEGCEDI